MFPLDLKAIAKSRSHEAVAAADLSSLPAMRADMLRIPPAVRVGFVQLLDQLPQPNDQTASSTPACLLDSLNAVYAACIVNSLELIAAFLSSHFLDIHHALRLESSIPGQLQKTLVNTSKEITSFWQACLITASAHHSAPTPDVSAHIQTELIDTERTYVDTLHKLFQFFYRPLTIACRQSQDKLAAIEFILNPLIPILDQHQKFLAKLEAQSIAELSVCDVFDTFFVDLTQIYQPFMVRFNESSCYVDSLLRDEISMCERALGAFLCTTNDEGMVSPRITSFGSLFIGVVQRLPRYLLFLNRLADHEPLSSALRCQSYARLVQAMIRDLDSLTTPLPVPVPLLKSPNKRLIFRRRSLKMGSSELLPRSPEKPPTPQPPLTSPDTSHSPVGKRLSHRRQSIWF